MKQTIRLDTFETNSSSYHTLSIQKISEKPKKREIIKGQDIVINNHVNFKTIGETESYNFIGTSSYEKAQMILRFIAYYIDDYFTKLHEYEPLYVNERGFWDNNKREAIFKEHFYEFPIIQAFVNAIKRFVGEDRSVTIEFNKSYSPYIEAVSDDETDLYVILGVATKEDLNDINKMTDVFYNIIFDDDIEIVEECESNE